jgi:septal ring factor EnvC (AmiA/AmiB activator)
LGKIALVKDDEYEVNPFEWAQASAQAHARTLQELEALRARVSEEQDSISKLKAQLDDFIKTKDETEKEMLRQFMQLLNEKKRKIRDQNRLLAGAKVDESTGMSVTFHTHLVLTRL